MKTILFFDDSRIYNRVGMKREYGVPAHRKEADMVFPHAPFSIQWPNGAWRDEDGLYHMVCQLAPEGENKFLSLAYVSSDALNWAPDNRAEEAGIKNIRFPNQCFDYDCGYEVGYIFYDRRAPADERLKALVNICNESGIWVEDILFTSPDGFRWKRKIGAVWNSRGAEPGVSCFYCEAADSNIIVCRPTWGDRRICVVKTADFRHFSYPELALDPDSEDPAMVETYGMSAFSYKGWYLGFLWLFHTISSDKNKFWEGKINCQLAYSKNGTHWNRSLRRPFIGNGPEGGLGAGMIYPSQMLTLDDGSLRILGGAFPLEHGHFTNPPGTLFHMDLREDGFVFLEAEEGGGKIFTRQILLKGGFTVNLEAKGATCAVYDNMSRPIEGFTHDDCARFDGDSTRWCPSWNGRDTAELFGRAVCLEIRLSSGRLYAINGEFDNLSYHEARHYVKFGGKLDDIGF